MSSSGWLLAVDINTGTLLAEREFAYESHDFPGLAAGNGFLFVPEYDEVAIVKMNATLELTQSLKLGNSSMGGICFRDPYLFSCNGRTLASFNLTRYVEKSTH